MCLSSFDQHRKQQPPSAVSSHHQYVFIGPRHHGSLCCLQLLTQHEHCYLVLLTASGGLTRRQQPSAQTSELVSSKMPSAPIADPLQPSGSPQQSAAAASEVHHQAPAQHPLSSAPQQPAVQQTHPQASQLDRHALVSLQCCNLSAKNKLAVQQIGAHSWAKKLKHCVTYMAV